MPTKKTAYGRGQKQMDKKAPPKKAKSKRLKGNPGTCPECGGSMERGTCTRCGMKVD